MAADHADIRVPPECREMIRAGALLAISTSGGKDSQAMTILLSRIVPRDQLVAVHAPLGEVEWEGTIQLIEATLPQGVPLIFAPVTSGKSLLDRVEERGKFPGIHQRWYTASHKRDPIERELRHFLKTHPRFGGRLVNCLGIRDAGQSPHWIYNHLSRCSCCFCIFSSPRDLRRAAELRPALYARYAQIGQRIGHTLSPSGRPLPELTGIPLDRPDSEDPIGLGGARQAR